MAKKESNRKVTKVTTFELDAMDEKRIQIVQDHLSEMGLPGVPMRGAVSWALKTACEKIEDGKDS